MRPSFVAPLVLLLACGTEASAPVVGDDELTASQAKQLAVPAEILAASFYDKPSPEDQSGLGVVLVPGVAIATSATSQALPTRTTLDGKALAPMKGRRVGLRDGDAFGVLVDDGTGSGARLGSPPPLLAPDQVTQGRACRALGTDLDMYSAGPPEAIALDVTIEELRRGHVLARSTKSTGGELSLLVCDGRLAGVSAGAGSQGTLFEYRLLDDALLGALRALAPK